MMRSPEENRDWRLARQVCLGLVLVCLSVPAAGADLSCGFTRLSDSPRAGRTTEVAALSSSGLEALLFSDADPLAQPGSFDFYRVSLEGRTPRPERATRLGLEPAVFETLAASDDLRRVIFLSDGNLTGENLDLSPELFLVDTLTGRLFQVTSSGAPEAAVVAAAISGDGTAVAYVLRGRGGTRTLVWRRLDGSGPVELQQFSSLAVPRQLSMSADGSRLAYQLRFTLSDFSELHLVEAPAGTDELVLTAGSIATSFLNREGDFLLAVTAADLAGLNLDGSLEIFGIELTESLNVSPPPLVPPISQLTDFPLSSGAVFDALSFSGDGRRIAFRSNQDLRGWDGGGAANYFLLDAVSATISQLTYWRAPQQAGGPILLDARGARLVTASSVDPISGRPQSSREAFLLECEAALVRYVPQVGNGVASPLRFSTSFVLSNTGENGSVRVDFFDQQGRPLPFPLEGHGVHSSYFFPVQAGTPLLLSSGGQGPIRAGYARVQAPARITGNAVFTGARHANNGVLYEAAVPLSEPLSDFSIVVTTRGNFLTGLALVNHMNPSDGDAAPSRAVVTLRLYDGDFQLLDQRQLVLEGGAHTAEFLERSFGSVAGIQDFVGVLTVSSTRPLAAVALRQNGDLPTLTTLTVAPGRADQ